MVGNTCDCENPAYGLMGRPNCIVQMATLAFPIIYPTYDSNGDYNTIDTSSATLGQDIKDLIAADSSTFRLYPFPKWENVDAPRTETQYETFPSGKKEKLPYVGGVRTFAGEMVGKDGAHALLREAKKFGCSSISVLWVTVDGNLWGIKDDPASSLIRGYKMDSGTWDAFYGYATYTTTNKTMISFDLDKLEREENAYVVTANELGYYATDLRPLMRANIDVTVDTATQITATVTRPYGSAVSTNQPIVGLLAANFTLENLTTAATVTPSGVAEVSDGVYEITITAQTTGDDGKLSVSAPGYEAAPATFDFL